VTTPPPTQRRVAVLTHMGRATAIDAATRLIRGLLENGITSALPAGDADCLPPELARAVVPLEPPDQASAEIELMVVLGGDGSILRGTEWVLAADVPLLGVNLGHVGFLAEAESSEIDSIVTRIVQRSYAVEERSTIEVALRDCASGEITWSSYAVNEVSVEKASRERVLEVLVEIDGRPLSRWACDGVLLATPTGSTAYAFSAGGPVIWPNVDALLVVPLSAHALFARPLVLGPTSRVVIQLIERSQTDGVVWCDGRRSAELRDGLQIEVQQGSHRLLLARLSEAPFTDRLVNKFGLRVEGWRGEAEERTDREDRTVSLGSGDNPDDRDDDRDDAPGYASGG
jgi:NAD+ kinase